MILGLFNYWVVVVLMMIGLYIVIAHGNLIKKIVGLTIFQTAVFIFYISMAKIDGATAPILAEGISQYSNPLPHVLILTAIVVGKQPGQGKQVQNVKQGMAIFRNFFFYAGVGSQQYDGADTRDYE